MSKNAGYTLFQHLQALPDEQIAALLRLRPDLATPAAANLSQLSARAQDLHSVQEALEGTNLLQNRLVQLLVICPRNPTHDQLEALLPEGVKLADVEPALVELERLALIWRNGGHIHFSAALVEANPFACRLGPPLESVASSLSHATIADAVRKIRADAGRSKSGAKRIKPPPPARSPKGGKPRKVDLVDELQALLSSPAVVNAVLEHAPPEASALARKHADMPIISGVDVSLSSYSTGRDHSPLRWLIDRVLVAPNGYYRAAQPREVTIALRGGRPLADLPVTAPELELRPSPDQSQVDADAANRAASAVRAIVDLCDWWAEEPLAGLKGGGLGVRALKAVGGKLDMEVIESSRLVEIAHAAGLVTWDVQATYDRRSVKDCYSAVPDRSSEEWLAREAAEQWVHVAGAWLRTSLLPSLAGAKDREGKTIPGMGYRCREGARLQRATVLAALDVLPAGRGASTGSLGPYLYWQRPLPFLYQWVSADDTAAFTIAEAELLGVAAHGRLSTFGSALLAGDAEKALASLGAAMPEEAVGFTVQADHTVVALGALPRATAIGLGQMSDVESKGSASTFRITEQSLRRALDAGRAPGEILSFLEMHATKGVPQAVAYLISDVGRRYGNVRFGEASSFVRCDDAALLADVISNRKTRKLGLTQLAPTVAVSPVAPGELVGTLRDAGFLPAPLAGGDGDGADVLGDSVIDLDPTGAHDRQETSAPALHEPFLDGLGASENGPLTRKHALSEARRLKKAKQTEPARSARTTKSAKSTKKAVDHDGKMLFPGLADGSGQLSIPGVRAAWTIEFPRGELDELISDAVAGSHLLFAAEVDTELGTLGDPFAVVPVLDGLEQCQTYDVMSDQFVVLEKALLGFVVDAGPADDALDALFELAFHTPRAAELDIDSDLTDADLLGLLLGASEGDNPMDTFPDNVFDMSSAKGSGNASGVRTGNRVKHPHTRRQRR